jgi:hypothetical protein
MGVFECITSVLHCTYIRLLPVVGLSKQELCIIKTNRSVEHIGYRSNLPIITVARYIVSCLANGEESWGFRPFPSIAVERRNLMGHSVRVPELKGGRYPLLA